MLSDNHCKRFTKLIAKFCRKCPDAYRQSLQKVHKLIAKFCKKSPYAYRKSLQNYAVKVQSYANRQLLQTRHN